MTQRKRLTVLADDFGMSPAVNEGIVRAFVDGVLTDSNVLVCAPSVAEAFSLAEVNDIPLGLHVAFTCEWDLHRWGPLTRMTTMVDHLGYFRYTVAAAWGAANYEEACVEADAQLSYALDHCRTVTHVGEHMGLDPHGLFWTLLRQQCTRGRIAHKGHWQDYAACDGMPRPQFVSSFSTSGREADYGKLKKWLQMRLLGLSAGHHLWVCHPGSNEARLDSMCSLAWPCRRWAGQIRVADLKLLLDPDVRRWCDDLDIQLTPLSSVPVGVREPSES
jgi:predicted glycoside hydrolase/deacetylase ChbG (UPF0249 family)